MRKQFLMKAILLLSAILVCQGVFCPVSQAALKGGCAKVNITPPVGAWLSGYESVSGTNLAKGAGELIVNHALDILDDVKAQ